MYLCSIVINIDQIEGSGPLQVSLGEARGKEHRCFHRNIIIIVIIVVIITIITIITRYQISKGDDGEVNVEVVLGPQADQAADE